MIQTAIVMGNGEAYIDCGTCPQCHRESRIKINADELLAYVEWTEGRLPIQRAFWMWAPAKREMLITGLHPECWTAYLGPEPDEDD